jgi:hypothetical protein
LSSFSSAAAITGVSNGFSARGPSAAGASTSVLSLEWRSLAAVEAAIVRAVLVVMVEGCAMRKRRRGDAWAGAQAK